MQCHRYKYHKKSWNRWKEIKSSLSSSLLALLHHYLAEEEGFRLLRIGAVRVPRFVFAWYLPTWSVELLPRTNPSSSLQDSSGIGTAGGSVSGSGESSPLDSADVSTLGVVDGSIDDSALVGTVYSSELRVGASFSSLEQNET
eukprot:CAMPEP_0170890434 /NCGR_PEP_ID=MMETSP0734-20130129/40106_1 /TAXON_ID=186038 /ORGANISM="Fragilariopsis kerguelensis, Strain L26-C5" /LENGTH=142 /DNA_ID=CAMNT_0011279303 /DNA_START=21 /DNA_END=449 /DNA_ORIENTATION=+